IPAGFTGSLTSTASATTPTTDPVPGCPQCVDVDTQGSGADLVVNLSDGQTTYTDPGTNTYTLTITNNGPGVATDVNVVNALPGGIPAANYTWTSSLPSSGTGGINETIPSIAVGQTVTYTITLEVPTGLTTDIVNQVSVTSTSSDPTPACDACTDTNVYSFGADIVVNNSDGNLVYVPGSNNIYTVTVNNLGPQNAADVTVNNPIPAGITNFSWVGSNGTSGTNVPLTDLIATLASGETVTYTITLGVPVGFTGPLTSEVTVTSATPDPNPGCTTCSDTDTQVASGADIYVLKTDNSATYTAGTTTSYTIQVVNNGPDAATGVVINDPVPAGIPAANVSWTSPSGSGTGALTDAIGNMTVGQTATYVVNVSIPADFDQETNLVNTVSVTSTTADPNPDCPGCTDTNVPLPQADLVTFKTDGKTKFTNSFSPEERWPYVITITNQGPSVAYNVVVSDPLPADITIMSWTGNGTGGNGALNDVIPVLQPGEIITYQVEIFIPSNYSVSHATLVNTVNVSSDTPDPTPACPGCTDSDTPENRFVTVETNLFTLDEIVEDVLIHSDCANVSNFTHSGYVANTSGSNASSCVGYFRKNNSTFPIKDGIIIGTAQVQGFEGNYSGGNGLPGSGNNNDQQLQDVSDAQGATNNINDVAYVQFDFTPLTNEFSFKFLFASEEYGIYQCFFGDVFAFLLTDLTDGTPPVNVAVIPDLLPPTPVSVLTVRDEAYNANCESVNEEWYGQHN
ncbi:MAG: DUF11 domain-containing protein, partial [Sphingobacteriales bacterium]